MTTNDTLTLTRPRCGPHALWRENDFPKSGWSWDDSNPETDLGQPTDFRCEACDCQHPRYVQHLVHDRLPGVRIDVGLECAGKLTGNAHEAKQRQAGMIKTAKAQAQAEWEKRVDNLNEGLVAMHGGYLHAVRGLHFDPMADGRWKVRNYDRNEENDFPGLEEAFRFSLKAYF